MWAPVNQSRSASRNVSQRTTHPRLSQHLVEWVTVLGPLRLCSRQVVQVEHQLLLCLAHSPVLVILILRVLVLVEAEVLSVKTSIHCLRLTRRCQLLVCKFDWLMAQGAISILFSFLFRNICLLCYVCRIVC